jgi:hypothetical protein
LTIIRYKTGVDFTNEKDAQLARLSSGSTESLPMQLLLFFKEINDRYFQGEVSDLLFPSQIPLNPKKA